MRSDGAAVGVATVSPSTSLVLPVLVIFSLLETVLGQFPGFDSVMNCVRTGCAQCRSCQPQLGFCRLCSAERARNATPYRRDNATSPELRRTRSRPPARAAV